ncbi:cytochrome P450 [Cristinia sonorae]|uniref:Cytochrome P450 n=1 Tax=Cristinia sonorae TaxID=1940300 RepID=A0A8K0UDE9_9AGAR|nr:cytochrome P450 [Cristinia sonorae]
MALIASVLIVVLALSWLLNRLLKIGSRELGLPPGPPTLPIIGNLLDFPKTAIYLRFTEWARTYGEIYSLKIGRGTVVVISSPRMVRELLDKHSAVTSGRQSLHFAKIVQDDINVAFLQATDPTCKGVRRGLQYLLSKEACAGHLPIQQAEASQLMYDLMKQPDAYFNHMERFSFSSMLSATFGVRCPRTDSKVLQEFSQIEHDWERLITPGHHPPIDLIPLLRYVPERWAKWKGISRDLEARFKRLYHGLVETCENRMEREEHNGSFMENILRSGERNESSRRTALAICFAAVEGGSITTTAFMRTLVCCLATHPDAQKRAHEEIDRVLGSSRMPVLEDIEQMPYIQAIIKEVQRFCPPAPFGLPHLSTAEVTVGEYVIPKNSSIIMNIYGIYHDEEVYEKPYMFYPDRFLQNEFGTIAGTDDTGRRNDLHFGAGRRICPGILLGTNATTIAALNFIWGFNVDVKSDPETGNRPSIDTNTFTKTFVISCVEIPADIRPRSDLHATMIRSQYSASRETMKNFEHELSPEDVVFVNSW